MGNSKIIYGGKVLIDLTSDTISADKLLKGYTAHGADGEALTGSCTFDSNTQDATATEAEILTGKTAYSRGVKISGKMKNNGAVSGTISTKDGKYTVPQGYHDGSGVVQIDSTEQAKIIANNIRDGVVILGVTGTMSGSEDIKSQSKTVTSSTVAQTILPDEGFTHLSQVVIAPIPYVENDNAAGGKTITIG